MENEWLEVSEIQDKVDEKLPASSPPVQPISQKLVMYCKEMKSLQIDASPKVENLQRRIMSSSSVLSVQVYYRMILELKDCFSGEFIAKNIMTIDVDKCSCKMRGISKL